MSLVLGTALTEEGIESLEMGRPFDALIETAVMGRRVKFSDGLPFAWDAEDKPVAHGPRDYILEDYDPKRDGPLHPLVKSMPVFPYSKDDRGLTRVADRLAGAPGILSVAVRWSSEPPEWRCEVAWTENGAGKTSIGRDAKEARFAVYRAALKAVLLK